MVSQDAMTSGSGAGRVEARVLLLIGDEAEVTTPERTYTDPVRVPVERLVSDTGIAREELPGRRLVVVLGEDGEPVRFEAG